MKILYSNLLMVFDCVLWGGLSWIGTMLIRGVTDQHVPGYPNQTQIFVYVTLPNVIVIMLILITLFGNLNSNSPELIRTASVLSLIFFPIYIIIFSGGI